jgi:hypothetical protein
VKSRAGLIVAVAATLSLTGCREDQQNSDGSLSSSSSGGRQLSVLASLRPKADPSVMQKLREEDAEKQRRQMEAMQAQQQALHQENQANDPASRDLPAVDMNPISGIASALGFNNPGSQTPPASPVGGGIPNTSGPGMSPMGMAPAPPPSTAMYGGYPSAGGAGMIPPPPAVSLTTAAQPYQPPVDPNFQQYMQAGAYGGGYGYQPPPQYMQPSSGPAHPAGSMFSNGGGGGSTAAPVVEEKKRPNLVVITPTGMDARSPYKQRDDLKVLMKGAFTVAPMPEIRDPKTQLVLAKADVGLPAESTKGNISLNARQMNALFKNPPIDRRILPSVLKVEQDVAQAYYRYLYAYNKFMLTQQQVAARKQEMEVAETSAEKQRAAADLATAQNDAEASKEDLRSAQTDLAAASGAQAARSVIAKVSGIAPSLESLAVAEPEQPQQAGGFMGSMQNAFGALNFWNRKGGGEQGGEQVAAAPAEKEKPKKEEKKEKGKDKKKGKGGDSGGSSQMAGLPPVTESAPPAIERASTPGSAGISFELKNVQTTPRKSVLKVAVRNNGGESFTLDPDVISVVEGDKRLAEASVLTQFDSTLVEPSSEVTGTITIFGRPWNDKLTVSLSNGGKAVQLRR